MQSLDHYSRSGDSFLSTTALQAIFTVLVAVAVAQWIIHRLDLPLLSLFEYSWNAVVYLLPSRLLFAMAGKDLPKDGIDQTGTSTSATHAAKSQALRSILGMQRASLSADEDSTSAVEEGVPTGLGNWDNSCYQNSVLQALSSVPSFLKFLDVDPAVASANDSAAKAFSDLAFSLNRRGSSRFIWTPAKLKSMSSWQQQDAQEYFSKIMEEMDKDVSINRSSKNKSASLLQHDSSDLSSALSETGEPSITNPIDGLLAQRVGCLRCGYSEGLSLIPFNCLTLPLGRAASYTIEDCLNSYTEVDHIEGVECARCTLLDSAQKLRSLQQKARAAASTTSQVQNRFQALDQRDATLNDDVAKRLKSIETALEEDDFSEQTLTQTCRISRKNRVQSDKSRQGVVIRAPECLVLHVNRSIFDEYTGALLKNSAALCCPLELDLSPWCVGGLKGGGDDVRQERTEQWNMDPSVSMVSSPEAVANDAPTCEYALKALITHYGRHENGHYICYRKVADGRGVKVDSEGKSSGDGQWWRISDETVTEASEEDIAAQSGVFMAFYERKAQPSSKKGDTDSDVQIVSAVAAVDADSRPDQPIGGQETTQRIADDTEASKADTSAALGDRDAEKVPLSATHSPLPMWTADVQQDHISGVERPHMVAGF